MESRNTNSNICSKNHQLRDNGHIIVGTIFCALNIIPVKTLMANDIYILDTPFPVIVITHPKRVTLMKVNTVLYGSISQGLFLSNDEKFKHHLGL